MKSLVPAAAVALLISPAQAQDTVDFSGAYVGLSVNRSSSDSFDSPTAVSATANGAALSAGYLFDLGNVVLGGDLSLRRTNYSAPNVTPSSGTTTSATVGLRLGYPVGRATPFIGARVGRGTDDFGTGTQDFDTRELSIGAEFAITDTVFTQISVEHSVFEYQDIDLNLRNNSVSLGLVMRF